MDELATARERTSQHVMITNVAQRFHDYADTAACDDEALRQVAREGEPTERALACWRLMMRGQAIHTTSAAGPDIGIRRLLLINLASAPELELLNAIAAHDPEPAIRCEAVAWIWRIAPDEGLRRLRECIRAEPDDEVVSELLATLPAIPWVTLAPELAHMLLRPSVALRRRATELVLDRAQSIPPGIRDALVRETDPDLRDFMLARWANSDEHCALLELCGAHPALVDPTLSALSDAGRSYSWEMLKPFATSATPEGLVRVLDPSSDDARRWLLGYVQDSLDHGGGDPVHALDSLATGFIGVSPGGLCPRDAAVAQLLGASEDVPWDSLDLELVRLLRSSSPWLRHAAADRLLSLTTSERVDSVIVAEIQGILVAEPSLSALSRWAASDEHATLLSAVLDDQDGHTMRLHGTALRALAGAGRSYPWEVLATLADFVVEALESVGDDYAEDFPILDDLATAVRRPWPPGARAWLVEVEPRLSRLDLLRELHTALVAIPVSARTLDELKCLARLGARPELAEPA